MIVRIKRVDKSLPMPEYKTKGAAAFDMYARETTIVPAKGWAKVPSNFIIEIPETYCLIISARSSLAKHHEGIFLANGIALIDSDFRGPNDEIHISVYNLKDHDITIKRGDRIAQGRFEKVIKAEWEETDTMNNENRSGFGSTGLN